MGAGMAALCGRVTPMAEQRSRQEKYMSYRLRVLPDQLERARRRYEMLKREAQRYGLPIDE